MRSAFNCFAWAIFFYVLNKCSVGVCVWFVVVVGRTFICLQPRFGKREETDLVCVWSLWGLFGIWGEEVVGGVSPVVSDLSYLKFVSQGLSASVIRSGGELCSYQAVGNYRSGWSVMVKLGRSGWWECIWEFTASSLYPCVYMLSSFYSLKKKKSEEAGMGKEPNHLYNLLAFIFLCTSCPYMPGSHVPWNRDWLLWVYYLEDDFRT